MIVNCPGVVGKIESCRELIDYSDLFPTFVELAGGKLPPDYPLDGHSFAPLLLGKPFKGRDWIFSYCGKRRMLRDKHWLFEGTDRFFYCGERRDGDGYREVTDSQEPEAVAARRRFEKILAKLPAPAPDDPLMAEYRQWEHDYPTCTEDAVTPFMKRPPKKSGPSAKINK